ncbi:MAG: hypothetical protein MUC84_01870 [Solirubrobacteraceae bacterium]|nr:hypothetical protein [Solirubrobacteraceae bacterium]MCU0312796.1 hypothetical protein [Solirubrobacteraceae bacterium]
MLRIARLRSLVAGGDYAVDPVLVADALLSRLIVPGPALGLDPFEAAPAAAVSRSGAPSPAAGRLERRAG